MTARQRTDLAARRREVSKLYLSGRTQPEIARQLQVSQPTISRDLKYLQEKWIQSALVDINEAKGKEIAKIDSLEIEYWEAWRRSLKERKETTTKGMISQGIQPKTVEQTIKRIETIGDPRFLQGVERCIDKRCQILGLDAPETFEVNWKSEIVDLLRENEIDPSQVVLDFGEVMAKELFSSAGIDVKFE